MIDQQWTLFLDRDGIINERIVGDYVRKKEQLIFKKDFLETIRQLRDNFGTIIIVTNQQGIAKGLMSEVDLSIVHQYLLDSLKKIGVTVDAIYYCPHLKESCCNCRKPGTGMAQQAKKDFPYINFNKSMIIGDSLSDVLFGKRCGMMTVLVDEKQPLLHADTAVTPDYYVKNLQELMVLIF